MALNGSFEGDGWLQGLGIALLSERGYNMKKMKRWAAGFMATVMVMLNVLTGVTTTWAADMTTIPVATPSGPEKRPGKDDVVTRSNAKPEESTEESSEESKEESAEESVAPETWGPVISVPSTESNPGTDADSDTESRGGTLADDADDVTTASPGEEPETETTPGAGSETESAPGAGAETETTPILPLQKYREGID